MAHGSFYFPGLKQVGFSLEAVELHKQYTSDAIQKNVEHADLSSRHL